MAKKIVLIVVALMTPLCLAILPPTIDVCHRNDPKLDQCIIKTVEKLRPLLKTGDFGEDLQIIPLDPIQLEGHQIGTRKSTYYAAFSNITAFGGSDFKINKLKANATSFHFDIDLTFPRIDFIGKYEIQFRILVIDIKGQGDVNGTISNTKAFVKLRGSRYFKDDVEYAKLDEIIIKANVGKLKIHFDNLFGGDQTLGDVGNTMVNEYQELYLDQIIPSFERSLSSKFLIIANNILTTASYDELFPTD